MHGDILPPAGNSAVSVQVRLLSSRMIRRLEIFHRIGLTYHHHYTIVYHNTHFNTITNKDIVLCN